MMLRFDRTLEKAKRAQSLRKNMTHAERKFWRGLNRKQLGGFKFRKRHPVGPYVLDFYCPEIKLCIELDGGQHGDEKETVRGTRRARFLESKKICVIRFWNAEFSKDLDGVLRAIHEQAYWLANEKELEQGCDIIPSPCKGEG